MEKKIVVATYDVETVFQVPTNWDVEKIAIYNGVVYYNFEIQPNLKGIDLHPKRPSSVYEADYENYYDYFVSGRQI